MLYATKDAAIAVRDELNRQRGYAPAHVYRLNRGGFTVIRTYAAKATMTDAFDTMTLDD